ncbi:vacuolar protein sorting-associated protein, partial [Cyclospora cayetanensis]
TPDLSLFLALRSSEPVECSVGVPALHSFTHAQLATEDRLYTLRLKTDQLSFSQTAGALYVWEFNFFGRGGTGDAKGGGNAPSRLECLKASC